jgi:hypothetical protein
MNAFFDSIAPRRAWGTATVVTYLMTSGNIAHAEPTRDSVAAEVLFQEGRKLVGEGRYAEGCSKLEASQRLDPGIGTLFNLADCQEKNGRLATAWGLFLEVASGARAAGNHPREQAARDRAASLESRMPRIVIKVSEPATSDLVLKRDGATVDRALWGTAVPVDPGTTTIEASAPGKKTWSKSLRLAAESAKVVVEVPQLEAVGAPATAPVPSSTPPETDHAHGGASKIAGFTLLGVGVVGVTVGAIFGLAARSKWNEARSYCVVGNQCLQRGLDLSDDAHGKATLSTIAFVGGGAALAGGTILVVTSRSGASAQPGVALGGSVDATGATAQLLGRF